MEHVLAGERIARGVVDISHDNRSPFPRKGERRRPAHAVAPPVTIATLFCEPHGTSGHSRRQQ